MTRIRRIVGEPVPASRQTAQWLLGLVVLMVIAVAFATSVAQQTQQHPVSMADAQHTVRATVSSGIAFDDGFIGIAGLSSLPGRPPQFILLEEISGGTKRTLRVTPGDTFGELAYQYRVNGEVQPLDEEARTWYEDMLELAVLKPFRNYYASNRTSGYAGGVWTEGDTLVSLIVDSTSEDRLILAPLLPNAVGPDVLLDKLVRAQHARAHDIIADQDLRRFLQSAVTKFDLEENDLEENAYRELLLAAREIHSNDIKAEFLMDVAEHLPRTPRVTAAYVETAGTITTEDLKQQVLDALETSGIERDTALAEAPRQPRVVIDPGHSDARPGAISIDGTLTEAAFNLQVAYKIKALLEAEGIEVILTRENGENLHDTLPGDLTARAAFASPETDLIISLHASSAGDPEQQGIETFFWHEASRIGTDTGSSNSKALAMVVQEHLIRATGAYNRGVKNAPFQILRQAQSPAVSVELGFLTNPEEAQKLATDAYQAILAGALTDAVLEFLSLQAETSETVQVELKRGNTVVALSRDELLEQLLEVLQSTLLSVDGEGASEEREVRFVITEVDREQGLVRAYGSGIEIQLEVREWEWAPGAAEMIYTVSVAVPTEALEVPDVVTGYQVAERYLERVMDALPRG